MNKKLLLILVFLGVLISKAQDIVLEKQLPEGFKIKRAFQIPNKTNNNLGLFFFNKKESKAFLFDNSMNEKSSIEFDAILNKYSSPLGGIVTNQNKFIFIVCNNTSDKFAVGEFDFNSKKAKFKESEIELKKERFLQHFAVEGSFYILTINNRSSILNLYRFNNQGEHKKEVIDLGETNFRHWNNNIVPLTTLLYSPFGKALETPLQKINTKTPNSLEITASPSKMFIENNKLYLALESNRSVTQAITIDLDNFSQTVTTFNKPFIANVVNGRKSNSFIFDNKYFGVTGASDIVKMEIKDFDTREVLKTYEIKKGENIPFKNAAIYFEGTGLGNRSKQIDNTNRFLRNISRSEVGISVFNQNGNNVITLGSFKEGVSGFGIGYGPIAAVYSYTTTKSTFIKCKFDKNYNYLEGVVKSNVLDSLKKFVDENGKGSHEEFTKVSDGYLYGSFNKSLNKYVVRRF
jgi:hypothetical protein